MATAGPPSSDGVTPPAKWSMYAGLYMFLCGTAVAFLLYDVLALLGEVLGLPAAFTTVILASPSLAIGALVWWALVERRASYTYLVGGAAGLLTALLTGVVWVARFVSGWGVEMGLAVGVLIGFVLGVAVTGGVLAGLPLMYARRRSKPPVSNP